MTNSAPWLWLSLGETCLAQHIINDNSLNTKYTPYSWTGTTLDRILSAEKDNYQKISDPQYFVYDFDYYPGLPQNQEYYAATNVAYNTDSKIFCKRFNGFYFFHDRDIAYNKDTMDNFKKRLSRMQSLSEQRIIFVYYYQALPNDTDRSPESVREMLREFAKPYVSNGNDVRLLLIHQNVDDSKKEYELVYEDDMLFEFLFTCSRWDPWNWDAKTEKDLFSEMVNTVLTKIN